MPVVDMVVTLGDRWVHLRMAKVWAKACPVWTQEVMDRLVTDRTILDTKEEVMERGKTGLGEECRTTGGAEKGGKPCLLAQWDVDLMDKPHSMYRVKQHLRTSDLKGFEQC